MPSIADIRAKFPQYEDLSDAQLADGVYKKFYSDMPREQFDQKVGITQAAPEPQAPPQSFREAQMRSVQEDRGALAAGSTVGFQGLTWNYGDEFVAGMMTPVEMAVGALTGEDEGKGFTDRVSDAYSRGLDLRRLQLETAREQHPYASLAGEVAGGMMTGGVGMGAAKTLGGRIAIGAAEGVGMGGLSGFGDGEGLEDRLAKAESGAKIGAGVGAALPVVGAAASSLARGVGNAVEPLTEKGRQRSAARLIDSNATDPVAVRKALDNPPEELVPGSEPTTFQQTGDMGLGQLERAKAAGKAADRFNQRRADQNAARLAAIDNIETEGHPEAVADLFKAQLRDLDEATAGAVSRATEEAGAALDNLDTVARESLSTAQSGAAARRAALESEGAADIAGAGQAARAAADALPEASSPEATGQALRGTLEARRAEAKTRERALWNAVDPDGTLVTQPNSIRQTAREALADLTPSARQPEGEEARLLGRIAEFGDTISFRELRDLNGSLKNAMREERMARGMTPAYRRMSMLASAVEEDLSSGVAQRAAQEAQAVAAGEMAPEDTMAASIQRNVDAWRAERSNEAGRAFAESAGGYAAGRSGVVRPGSGGQSAARGRLSNAPGNSRLSPSPDGQLAGPEDVARLNEARIATRERAETFDNRTLAPLTRRPTSTSPYDVSDPALPDRLFRPGDAGGEAIRAFRRAGGGDEALEPLKEHAGRLIKRFARKPDGTLDPKRVDAWRKRYAGALREFPDLDRAFADAATASQTVADVEARRGDLLKTFDASAQGRAASVQFPEDTRRATDGLASGEQARRRVDTVSDWQRKNAELLGENESLTTATGRGREAADRLISATERRKTQMDAFRKSIRGKIAGLDDRGDIQRTVGSVFSSQTPTRTMRELAEATSGSKDGRAGLRRSIVEHIQRLATTTAEAATTGKDQLSAASFQRFVRMNREALSEVFSPREIENMQRIARDFQRANRSVNAVRGTANSDTAEKLAAMNTKGSGPSVLSQVFNAYRTGAIGGAVGVSAMGGNLGQTAAAIGVGVASELVGSLRKKGFAKIDDLVTEAMLDPRLARELLAQRPLDKKAAERIAARILGGVTAPTGARVEGKEEKPAPERRSEVEGTRAAPVRVSSAADADKAGARAVQPTEAQAKAGNYAKGHARIAGLDISIETPRGGVRRGRDEDGNEWSARVGGHYGYIKGTTGADGDHLDVFVGRHPQSETAFVIDQKNLRTGRYDETKIVLGARSQADAEAIYRRSFSDGKGKERIASVAEVPVDGLKRWISEGDTRKAFSAA